MLTSRYHIIKNFKELRQLVKACKKTSITSVDFETNGEKLYNDSTFIPTILSVSFQAGSGIAIPLAHPESAFLRNGKWRKVLRYFGRQVIENPRITKFAWNWKFDNQIFAKYGIYSRGTCIDGMLAKYLLNEERPNGLKDMVRRYLPEFSGYEKFDDFDKVPWDKKPLQPLCQYGCMDTDATLRLSLFFESRLIELGMYTLYRNLIMPASRVLQSAESYGMLIDTDLNLELHTKYEGLIKEAYEDCLNIPQVKRYEKVLLKQRKQALIDKLQAEIEELSEDKVKQIQARENKISRILIGDLVTKEERKIIEPLNLGSTQQLVQLMYIHEKGLRFPIIEYTKDAKTKKRSTNPSTAEEVILKLKEYDKTGFIDKLLTLRGYEHNYSTFIKGYAELIQEDNKLHPTFLLMGTVTGRLSSSKPNAQQIPKKEVNPDIKRQYIAPPGMLYLAFDYSQAELRIMAHLSGDETLLEAFRLGRDPHLAIACKKYGKDYDKILPIYNDETHPNYKEWKVKRKQAKQIVFGCIYGIEAKKLSTQLSDPKMGIIITEKQAQQFLNEFFRDHPKVKNFMENQGKKMEEQGYVESLFGRKRRCPTIYSENYGEYLEAVRQSINAPCQSAGSDMALFASVLIYWDIKQGKLPFFKEVSTVHDSIYNYITPDFINPWLIYQLYQICKNPDTKTYFGFEIDDVSMAMDFTVGRNMIEEFPHTPGYDYTKMLEPTWDKDEYYREHKKVKGIDIDDYPTKFPEYFTEEFIQNFKKYWTKKFNTTTIWDPKKLKKSRTIA